MKGYNSQNDSSPHCSELRHKNSAPFRLQNERGCFIGKCFWWNTQQGIYAGRSKILRIADEPLRYGCCPFHDDRTPSLKVYDDHFYCFGCGATGDCTGFTAKLFGISQIEAAKIISYDFGLNLFNGEIAVSVNSRLKSENDFHVWMRNANLAVSEYLSKLNEWRKIYAPQNQWEQLHPLFVESLKRTDYVEYLSDLMAHGTDKEKKLYYKENGNDIKKYRNVLKSSPLRFILWNAKQFDGGILINDTWR